MVFTNYNRCVDLIYWEAEMLRRASYEENATITVETAVTHPLYTEMYLESTQDHLHLKSPAILLAVCL